MTLPHSPHRVQHAGEAACFPVSFGIGMVGVSVIISFRNTEFLSVISLLHIDLWKQKDVVCRIFKAGLFVKG